MFPYSPPTPHPMPDLEAPLPEDKMLAGAPGVYLLLYKNEVVYVGQSCDITARLKQHRKDSKKTFDSVKVYHIGTLNTRLRLETMLIVYYMPRYNKGLNLGLSEGRLWEIKWKRR